MKRLVNGVEVELTSGDVEIHTMHDRLVVKSGGKAHTAVSVRHGDKVHISYLGQQFVVEKAGARARSAQHHSGEIHAPMPGLIVDIAVEQGQEVEKGAKIVVLEAMKTQQPFSAPFDGTVDRLTVKVGDQVVDGQLLALVRPKDADS